MMFVKDSNKHTIFEPEIYEKITNGLNQHCNANIKTYFEFITYVYTLKKEAEKTPPPPDFISFIIQLTNNENTGEVIEAIKNLI